MSILSGIGDFIGLDIGTTAVRLVQLSGPAPIKTLSRYAYAPIEGNLAMSDSKADQQKLAQVIKGLIEQSQVTTKNVAVGLPSQRVFTTVVDFDRLSDADLNKAIRLQADSLIPTPFAESKLAWSKIGDSPIDKTKIEVLLTSVSNDYIEARLDMLESIGLNVIAFEPDTLCLSRAVLATDAAAPQLIIDIGSKTADLVLVMNGAPRLTRTIPVGTQSIIKAAAQNLNIDDKQAEQFVFKFGLASDKLEGQIYQAIISTIDLLTSEVDKSIKFFANRYNGAAIEKIVISGAASTLPEFSGYLANKFGTNVEIANAWRNVSYPAEREAELRAVTSQFGVAAGLAERVE